ncbi:class I SAM-dependent methyltransferase [Mycobacterium spongiae]|uniref:Methyltransferase domain-containing protein n=1 Tax=Mycobacterium spongiae TaxID=886343 RepID=A0A975PVA9_9MYCO|nr:class I SAM-dependent methyltransferase [Mycobacterium spongiae]QUR65920.1 methyltransferase domain-containing protein [Mycobacterium spongiae]
MDYPSDPSVHAESSSNSADALSAHLADDLMSTSAGEWHTFYDLLSRRLETAGLAPVSFFLNYGYVPTDSNNESSFTIRDGTFNADSVRLVFEVIGSLDLNGRTIVDIGCGRGGTAALVADNFKAHVTGVDMSSEAIAFCRKTHLNPSAHFMVGDALNIPLDDASCDVIINLESSHSYSNLTRFLDEVRRISRPGAWFLHSDLLGVEDWDHVRMRLKALGFITECDRDITANVLAARDQASDSWDRVFGDGSPRVANFLALPGSSMYEQLRARTWEYRIVRSHVPAV